MDRLEILSVALNALYALSTQENEESASAAWQLQRMLTELDEQGLQVIWHESTQSYTVSETPELMIEGTDKPNAAEQYARLITALNVVVTLAVTTSDLELFHAVRPQATRIVDEMHEAGYQETYHTDTQSFTVERIRAKAGETL